jgi:hypothetical protein
VLYRGWNILFPFGENDATFPGFVSKYSIVGIPFPQLPLPTPPPCHQTNINKLRKVLLHSTRSMIRELIEYLHSSLLATAMVFFKSGGAILFGALDVLQVSFAAVTTIAMTYGVQEPILDSQRLGWLFAHWVL